MASSLQFVVTRRDNVVVVSPSALFTYPVGIVVVPLHQSQIPSHEASAVASAKQLTK